MNIITCAYVPAGYAWYKAKGKLFKTPQPGDLAFFAFDPLLKTKKVPQHIGVVSKVFPDYFLCIEGNTSNPTAGAGASQDNGGGVFEKKRYYSQVLSFGRPNYDQ